METLYKSIRGVMLFLIIVLLCQTFIGDKFAQNMSMVILFSMLILNSEKVASGTAVLIGMYLILKNSSSTVKVINSLGGVYTSGVKTLQGR